jgi:hypothetical protein
MFSHKECLLNPVRCISFVIGGMLSPFPGTTHSLIGLAVVGTAFVIDRKMLPDNGLSRGGEGLNLLWRGEKK